jgi:DNA-binding GntR family transcriptional regulator
MVAGATLVESTIAARYNVSRTPVREALRRLEQDDLVEQGDRGLVVRLRSPEEILEIYSVRVVLEGLAARTAAEFRSELDLANMADRHARMLVVNDKDPDFMAAANQQFHQALWASSHNRTLVDLLIRLSSHLVRYPATTLASPGRWETVLKDHQRLIDAITARDAETAGSIAEAHMAAARDIKLRISASEES